MDRPEGVLPPAKAIRAKCLECSNFQPSEVRECHLEDCPLYHYRFGKNPFTGRKGNPNPHWLHKKDQED